MNHSNHQINKSDFGFKSPMLDALFGSDSTLRSSISCDEKILLAKSNQSTQNKVKNTQTKDKEDYSR